MSRRLATDLLIVIGAFVAVTLVAQVAGAPNLGTAMTFGQLAFAGGRRDRQAPERTLTGSTAPMPGPAVSGACGPRAA